MRGNELSREAGAVKGLHVGSGGSRNRPFEDLAAAVVRQAASDDYLARKKIDDNRKWLNKNHRCFENRRIYRRYYHHLLRLTGHVNRLYIIARDTDDAYKTLCTIRDICQYPEYFWMMKRKRWFGRTVTRLDAMVDAESTIRDVKAFFHSEWFVQLCDADGPMLYRQIVENYRLGRRPKGAE